MTREKDHYDLQTLDEWLSQVMKRKGKCHEEETVCRLSISQSTKSNLKGRDKYKYILEISIKSQSCLQNYKSS